MDRTWEVDEATTVKARFGAFGKKVVQINGNEVHNSRKTGRTGEILFSLPDGRQATLSLTKEFIGRPAIDLRVDGQSVVATGKAPLKCASCAAVAKPYDRFCGNCGQAMPTAEDYRLRKHVNDATGAIKVLGVLFLIVAIAFFFVAKGNADPALAKLDGMDPASMYPTPIDGQTYTVGELREQIAWEPWGVLIVNLILGAAMLVLSVWARRSPLPAVLIAAAIYAVVIVANGIVDPATLGQGLILKVIIIAFLFKGIKAALALRTANA